MRAARAAGAEELRQAWKAGFGPRRRGWQRCPSCGRDFSARSLLIHAQRCTGDFEWASVQNPEPPAFSFHRAEWNSDTTVPEGAPEEPPEPPEDVAGFAGFAGFAGGGGPSGRPAPRPSADRSWEQQWQDAGGGGPAARPERPAEGGGPAARPERPAPRPSADRSWEQQWQDAQDEWASAQAHFEAQRRQRAASRARWEAAQAAEAARQDARSRRRRGSRQGQGQGQGQAAPPPPRARRQSAPAREDPEALRQRRLAQEREERRRSEAALQRYDARWEAFVARAPASISAGDIPWVPLPALRSALAHASGSDAAADGRKQMLRRATLRWHPDKFTQAFGQRLAAAEREAILDKVKGIAQELNALR